jgi:hypothetical protein
MTIIVLAVAGIVGLSVRGGEKSALDPMRPERTFYTSLIPQETAFTVSTLFIDGAAGKELEILEVRPLGSPNLTYLGAITVWPRDSKTSWSDGGEGFPTDGIRDYHPAIGAVIPATETGFTFPEEPGDPRPVLVNAGFRLASGSVGFVNGVEVVYRIGGSKKRERARTAIIVCMHPCKERPVDNDLRTWELNLRDRLGLKELHLLPAGK